MGAQLTLGLQDMMFYLGLCGNSARFKKVSFLIFSLVLIEMFLWGEKASGPVIAVVFFYCGYNLTNTNLKLKRLIVPSVLLFSSIFALYFLVVSSLGVYSSNVVVGGFVHRLAKQGQVWWKVDKIQNEVSSKYFDKSVIDNLNYYENDIDTNPMGERYLKSKLMSETQLDHKGSFSGIYPSILYLNNNFFEMLIYSQLFNLLYFMIIIFMFKYTYRGFLVYFSPISAYILAYVLKIFESGNIYLLTSSKFIFVLLIMITFVVHINTKQKH